MVKISRVLDSTVIGEEASQGTLAASFNITSFGDISSVAFNFDDEVFQVKGITGGTTSGHKISKQVDLKHTPTGSISFLPQDLTFFKYGFGDYAEGAGDYTINNASTALPTSLSFKGNYDNTDSVYITGCYLNNWKLNLTTGSIVQLGADLIGMKPTKVAGLVSYTSASDDPLVFSSGVVTFGGTEWDLENLNITYNPKFMQKWSIKTLTAGSKRFPNEILRAGKQEISFEGVANVIDSLDELDSSWGGASPADSRTDINLVLTFTQNSKVHTITLTGRTNKNSITNTDSEDDTKKLVFSGLGTDITIGGNL